MGIAGWGWALLLASQVPEEPGGLRGPLTSTVTAASAPNSEGTPPIAEPPTSPPPPTPTPPPPPRDPAALVLRFDQAVFALARGDEAEARTLLSAIERDAPGSERGRAARQILALLAERRVEPEVAPIPGVMETTRDGPPSIYSRAELIVLQTIHGLVVGGEICVITECNGAQMVGGVLLGTGAVALVTSLILTNGGITPGQTASLDAGALWGGSLTLSLMGAIGGDDGISSGEVGAVLAGQLVGMGLGQGIWMLTRAGPGDVSLASSGGLWFGTLSALTALMLATDAGIEGTTMAGVIFGGGLAGLGLGATLAHYAPMSRGRVFIIDGGALVGTLMGVGVSLLVAADGQEAFLPPALGLVAGLGLTAYLTRHFDEPEAPQVAAFATPTDGGLLVGVGGAF